MRTTIAISAALATAAMASADLTPYSQDFEAMNATDPAALTNDGWKVFANVFDGGGNYLYGYGPFDAPNGTGAFCDVASGGGGANQGSQYLNVFSDYNNGDHGIGNLIESNTFQEQTIGAADAGSTWEFEFDYRNAGEFGPGGSASTLAFIKVLDPDTGFQLLAFPTIDTTNSTETWTENAKISITIDAAWAGDILQFGFANTATNYDPTGIYYDNVSFTQVPGPAVLALLGLGGLVSRRRRN